MARVKADERRKTAEKVRAYLGRHAGGDPAAADLSLDGIARGAKISRTPLSDPDCPVMTEVRAEIEAARGTTPAAAAAPAAQPPAPAASEPPRAAEPDAPALTSAPAPPGLEHLTSDDLAARIRRVQQGAGRVMTQWLGHHGRGGAVEDAALARHDLERAIWALRKAADELGPLVELRDAREEAAAADLPAAGAITRQGTLALDPPPTGPATRGVPPGEGGR